MSQQIPEGHYLDEEGRSQKDRRKHTDRRAENGSKQDHDRRKFFRRKEDQELLEKDHQVMIEEALDEFASDHDGHL